MPDSKEKGKIQVLRQTETQIFDHHVVFSYYDLFKFGIVISKYF